MDSSVYEEPTIENLLEADIDQWEKQLVVYKSVVKESEEYIDGIFEEGNKHPQNHLRADGGKYETLADISLANTVIDELKDNGHNIKKLDEEKFVEYIHGGSLNSSRGFGKLASVAAVGMLGLAGCSGIPASDDDTGSTPTAEVTETPDNTPTEEPIEKPDIQTIDSYNQLYENLSSESPELAEEFNDYIVAHEDDEKADYFVAHISDIEHGDMQKKMIQSFISDQSINEEDVYSVALATEYQDQPEFRESMLEHGIENSDDDKLPDWLEAELPSSMTQKNTDKDPYNDDTEYLVMSDQEDLEQDPDLSKPTIIFEVDKASGAEGIPDHVKQSMQEFGEDDPNGPAEFIFIEDEDNLPSTADRDSILFGELSENHRDMKYAQWIYITDKDLEGAYGVATNTETVIQQNQLDDAKTLAHETAHLMGIDDRDFDHIHKNSEVESVMTSSSSDRPLKLTDEEWDYVRNGNYGQVDDEGEDDLEQGLEEKVNSTMEHEDLDG